jgi:tetratricopeptide (TPR) repeat protein
MSALTKQLLRPRSSPTQRIWHIGGDPSPDTGSDSADLRLAVCPDQHETFASLRAVLAQLADWARPEQRQDLRKLFGYLDEACPRAVTSAVATHGKLLADSVAFAIMRRISRESFYTARIIDLSARLMNEVLSRVPGCLRVHVDQVDRLDRPSLKALARAMLLLEPKHGFSWIWHSVSDPVASPSDTDGLLFLSRGQLLRQLVGILDPTLRRGPAIAPLGSASAEAVSIYDISAALVLQNYDACFLWTDSLLGGADLASSQSLRLAALAAVNIGRNEDALRLLKRAEEMATSSGWRAHLCYLQGLIEAKRGYDVSKSTTHYERGLAVLESHQGNGEDLPLERGWLLNGLALNEAILWRRDLAALHHFSRAFTLERDAFALVAEGDDPARTYLRFNLLANSAFLMEIRGNYELAIDIFRNTFGLEMDEAHDRKQRWRSTLGYRIGVLHHRAGQLEEASRCLREAAEQDAATESWATQERILRAIGALELDRGAFAEAAETFGRGLDICLAARSAEGAREHARGLMCALLSNGDERRAGEVNEALGSEEDLQLVPEGKSRSRLVIEDCRPNAPSPKLPAYFPEIDLEGIPSIDLNRFLGKVHTRDWDGGAVWRK